METGVAKGKRIALGHKARVGKDSFAEIVGSMPGAPKVYVLRFAAELYNLAAKVQAHMGEAVVKDPKLLQGLGVLMRELYGADCWARSVEREIQRIDRVDPGATIVIVDMRFHNEMALALRWGFVTVRITRPDRPLDRDAAHISEVELDGAPFDYTIVNDGTYDEYAEKVREFVHKLYT